MKRNQLRGPFTSRLAREVASDVLDRFLHYVIVDTQSARNSHQSPSTAGQLELGRILVNELKRIGADDATLDANGYVMATLAATVQDAPVVGMLAHLDTSPDAPGADVIPLLHVAYDGQLLRLPRGGTVLDPSSMPALARKRGHDIVSSSGDTLLGADDKAGVAEIMAAVAYLNDHPELPRPTLRIGFMPDEEVGGGARGFDVERFGAGWAYTVDGSELGELQDETFAGCKVTLKLHGVEAHAGWGNGRLVNAVRVAGRVLSSLPADRLSPESTSERDGFIHPYEVNASAKTALIEAIVRDFDEAQLSDHVTLLVRTAEAVVDATPGARLEVDVEHQYSNLRTYLAATPEIVDAAARAMRAEGVNPVRTPLRGGTDGSVLSSMGLPTPNLFTGGYEYHSVREWASVQDMAAAAATLVRLAGVCAGGV